MRKKRKSAFDQLTSDEAREAWARLRKRRPDVSRDLETLATEILSEARVDPDAIADEVVEALSSVDAEEALRCAGDDGDGYVEPGEAAHDLLEAEFEPFVTALQDLHARGRHAEALAHAKGTLLGLHRLVSECPSGSALREHDDGDFLNAGAGEIIAAWQALPEESRKAALEESGRDGEPVQDLRAFVTERMPKWVRFF